MMSLPCPCHHHRSEQGAVNHTAAISWPQAAVGDKAKR